MLNRAPRKEDWLIFRLFHVTDWLPTLYAAAGGNPKVAMRHLDGIDMYKRIMKGLPSKRVEMLYNISPTLPIFGWMHCGGAIRSALTLTPSCRRSYFTSIPEWVTTNSSLVTQEQQFHCHSATWTLLKLVQSWNLVKGAKSTVQLTLFSVACSIDLIVFFPQVELHCCFP